jgi:hypothetical protein
LLEEIGRFEAALGDYEGVLKTSPGRYQSLLGAGRAAKHGGDRTKARSNYAALLAQCGTAVRPGVTEARTFVEQAQ